MNQVGASPPLTSAPRPIGVLLVNLGTPDAPTTPDVRRYLAEFLSDPRVIDINPLGRWLLLNLVILPFRPAKSAAAYRAIWTPGGSPLLVHGRALAEGVQAALDGASPGRFVVKLAMRYGKPAIPDVLAEMLAQDLERLVVLPLFPQYSGAASGSALERVFEAVKTAWNVPPIDTFDAFYDAPAFIDGFRDVAAPLLGPFAPDHVLFSYHGLPERQIKRSDRTGGHHCLASPDCCAKITAANRYCYRAHCVATTEALARALALPTGGYTFSFQSRLGRTPWIKPYTDEVLPELARRGVRRLAVFSPAFVADCLETVEEIGIRAHEQWKSLGGEDLMLVPSLNAHPTWVKGLARMVLDRTGVAAAPQA
ncbi:MAG: ferrochelatase [Myxococcales bacterium]|nr:ferrochelatase [Myxococcales bacterium]